MANDYDELPPRVFGEHQFAVENALLFDRYVEYRLMGVPPGIAFRKSFPRQYCDDFQKLPIYADAVEFNLYTIRRLRDKINEIDVSQLWNNKISIHEMLSIVRDPSAPAAAKARVMESLNLLAGITMIDDKGKTRLGSSLDDFYKDQAEMAKGTISATPAPAPATETKEETTP
jgi:hypothetical protein